MPRKRQKKITKTAKSKKTLKVVNSSKGKIPIVNSKSQTISEQLKLGESYVSLVLGAVVVLGLSILFFMFLKGKGNSFSSPQSESAVPTTAATQEKTYILQEGEYLWDVAVKFYGDGFKWPEIVKANRLENPDYVPPGTRLIIPNAK